MTEIIAKLEQIVGSTDVLTGDERLTRTPAWETHQPCNALAIVRPSSTDEVAEVMRLCHELGQTVVPYGGLTNLVQGCVTTDKDIALSFERMNQIEEVDRTGLTMVAGAGVTLQQAQERAEQAGLFFPVDIGARGTCMVGGNVSTNAKEIASVSQRVSVLESSLAELIRGLGNDKVEQTRILTQLQTDMSYTRAAVEDLRSATRGQ